MGSDVPPYPDGLEAYGRGRRLWRAVHRGYQLRADERVLLAEACRAADLADELRERVEQDGVTAAGSRGQTVVHPALVELRQVRGELRRSLGQLGLPDDAGDTLASKRARQAAQARWRNRGA